LDAGSTCEEGVLAHGPDGFVGSDVDGDDVAPSLRSQKHFAGSRTRSGDGASEEGEGHFARGEEFLEVPCKLSIDRCIRRHRHHRTWPGLDEVLIGDEEIQDEDRVTVTMFDAIVEFSDPILLEGALGVDKAGAPGWCLATEVGTGHDRWWTLGEPRGITWRKTGSAGGSGRSREGLARGREACIQRHSSEGRVKSWCSVELVIECDGGCGMGSFYCRDCTAYDKIVS